MKINSKHLKSCVFTLMVISISLFILSSYKQTEQPNKGNIEGYIFPKEAKPRVIVAIPHPQRPDDTLHRVAVPNASGYFKINNVPVGTQTVIYEPRDRTYRSKVKAIVVVASQTVNAGTETLSREQ